MFPAFFSTEVSFTTDISYLRDCKRVRSVPNWEESSWPFKGATGPVSRVFLREPMEILTKVYAVRDFTQLHWIFFFVLARMGCN